MSFLLVVGTVTSFWTAILCVGKAIATKNIESRVVHDYGRESIIHRALNEVSIALFASCFPLPSFNFAFWIEDCQSH